MMQCMEIKQEDISLNFDGITLTTVHGAGHEVPTYKPQAALELINNFFI